MGLLKITEEYALDENRTTEPILLEEILTAPTLVVYDKIAQAVMPKSMVSDLKWFNSDWIKFED